jgi:hypothetical protein
MIVHLIDRACRPARMMCGQVEPNATRPTEWTDAPGEVSCGACLDAHFARRFEVSAVEPLGMPFAPSGDHKRTLGEVAIQQRANALADECGILRDENTKLLAENARLRRELERGKR